MTVIEVSRVRRGVQALAFLMLAGLPVGCGGEGGSVESTPTTPQTTALPKGAAPRVPRGPEQAKVLQDQVKKK